MIARSRAIRCVACLAHSPALGCNNQGGMVEQHIRARAQAAVLFAEDRFAEAADMARSGLAVTRRSMDRGGAMAEHDWLQEIKLQAEARNPQPIFR